MNYQLNNFLFNSIGYVKEPIFNYITLKITNYLFLFMSYNIYIAKLLTEKLKKSYLLPNEIMINW